jgi:hypothetical protein
VPGDAGPHGVLGDIPNDRHQLRVALDDHSFEPLAEQVTRTAVSSIEHPRMATQKLRHSFGEVSLAGTNQGVEVVTHQAVRQLSPLAVPYDCIEQAEEVGPVDIVEVDVFAVISS